MKTELTSMPVTFLRSNSTFCEFKTLGIEYNLMGHEAIAEPFSAFSSLIFAVFGIWIMHMWEVHMHLQTIKGAAYLCFVGFGSFAYHITFWDVFAHFDIIPMILLLGSGLTSSVYELIACKQLYSKRDQTYILGLIITGSELFTAGTLIMSIYTHIYEHIFTIGIILLCLFNFAFYKIMTYQRVILDEIETNNILSLNFIENYGVLYKLHWITLGCALICAVSKFMDEIWCEYDQRVAYFHFHTWWHLAIAMYTLCYAAILQYQYSMDTSHEKIKIKLWRWWLPLPIVITDYKSSHKKLN